ncbi:MAG: RDD family protein [bacterium]|nr:RDD family protein [bacterium]
MENVGIQTSQNVFIKNKVASVGERMLATIIDFAIIACYIYIMALISNAFDYSDRNIFIFIMSIPLFFYNLASDIFLNGQTIGKKALKIKVVKIDGSQPSIGSYFIRWVFRIIDVYTIYGAVGIITVAVNGKGQRLGDIVAKTTVISIKRRDTLQDTIYVEIEEEYKLKYPDVNLLNDSDIKTVKDVLQHYSKNIGKSNAAVMVEKTCAAIEKKIAVTKDVPPLQFLKKIMTDYNYVYKNNNI